MSGSVMRLGEGEGGRKEVGLPGWGEWERREAWREGADVKSLLARRQRKSGFVANGDPPG